MLLMFRLLLVFGLVFPFARLLLVLARKWSDSRNLNIRFQIRTVQNGQQDNIKKTTMCILENYVKFTVIDSLLSEIHYNISPQCRRS